MNRDRRLHRELTAWLTAEATGDDARAEAAFAAMIGGLPRLGPSAGFAERVVMAAAPATSVVPVWLTWLARGALAASIALVAMATGLVPALATAVGLPTLGGIAKTAANGLSWIGARFETGLEVWEFLGRIGEAISLGLRTPEAQAGLAGTVVLGTIALYTLHHLLTFERRPIR